MRISIRIPADSNLKVEKGPLDFVYKDYKFRLHPNSEKIVSEVTISKRVEIDDQFLKASTKVKEGWDSKESEIPPKHPADKEMIDALKFFENVMFDECDLKLHWDKINCHYDAENGKEEKLLEEGRISRGWGRVIHVKGPAILEDPGAITCRMEYSEGLDIELKFFKHANAAIKEENYIEAYFNLYLILESYYAGGQHKYQDKVFKKNKLLINVLEELLNDHKTKPLYEKILKGKAITAETVIEEFVKTRQKIFHFLDINRSDRHITYENQEEYRNHAIALRGVVWRAMMQRQKITGRRKKVGHT